MPKSNPYAQKAESVQSGAVAKPVSRGPYFRIVSEEEPPRTFGWCIWSVSPPTEAEIIATAERAVKKMNPAYRCRHHWEPIRDEPVSHDGLTGAPAKQEAIRRIMEAGVDSPGKRFLDDRRAILKTVPKTTRKKVASRKMIDRLSEPLVTGQGPVVFDPNDPEFSNEANG